MAIRAAPKKQPSAKQTEISKTANDAFWAALHGNHYDDIPRVKELLQQAYLTDPFDATTTAHLGFLHVWRVSERDRMPELKATVTDDLILSQAYFAEAVEMTQDPRYIGFLAGMELAIGSTHKDQRMLRTGYFRMEQAVKDFPEFNLFSRGYSKSQFPKDSDFFKRGLEDMWVNIENCFVGKLDRKDPDYTPFMSQMTTVGPKRVCWNSWMVPHNHEGFALNLGDMLVKAGDTKAAKRMYENAKLSETYEKWPYKDLLEQRLEKLDENVEVFRRPIDQQPKDRKLMFASGASCSGCHSTLE